MNLDMSDREKERERDRIKEALADPMFQVIPSLPQGSEVRRIHESLKEELNDMLHKLDNVTEEGGTATPVCLHEPQACWICCIIPGPRGRIETWIPLPPQASHG